MNDQLVQRFVDQELTADERVQLLIRLGRDEELRERVVALERLSLEASQLPRPVVPDGFVAAVLKQTAAPSPSRWQRAMSALWTPHAFQWNLAGAAAACVVLAAIAAGISSRWSSTPPAPVMTAVVTPAPERVLVRLLVVHPGARTVQAAGDFNGWNPARTPLEPGRYEYQFVVDGEQWIADPFAIEQSDDGFGSRNAVLDVRPASEEPL
jgi:hypothetical protein